MSDTFENITFDLPKNQSNVIKVIGVGGGGSNAINHMFNQGIKGVDFVVCNTDHQALGSSPVPTKIQLGVTLTEGLGAGANPEIGQQSALESIEEIEKLLDTNTKMVFITAGMGGGTGTGAAPVIAKLAKDRDILTVGIVTIPFQFEGKQRQEQALRGVENLRANVDSLIVINNNKLREVYGNLGFKAGFSKADEVLATASRGIAEVITHHYTQNIDLKDAKTVLSNSGTAIMGSSIASGDNRAKEAIVSALDSPLLNDNKIRGAKNVLLLIVSGENEITIDEIGEINDHIQNEAGYNANIIMGVGEDFELGDSIAVTVIATGFNVEQQKEIFSSSEANKIIHMLGDEQKAVQDFSQNLPHQISVPTPDQPLNQTTVFHQPERIVYSLDGNSNEGNVENTFEKKTLVQTNEVAHAVAPSEVQQVQPVQPVHNVQPVHQPVISNVVTETKVRTVDIRDIEVIEPDFIIVKPKATAPQMQQPALEFSFDIYEQQQAFEEDHSEFDFGFNAPASVQEVEKEEERIEEIYSESDKITYDLGDYMDKEEELIKATPKVIEEELEEELNLTVRTVETPQAFANPSVDHSPVDSSIEDILRNRAEERKMKMKRFNHKFNATSAQLNDLEREPAYKRMGVDLNTSSAEQVSRYSVGNNVDSLRSNNSFLHDNVD